MSDIKRTSCSAASKIADAEPGNLLHASIFFPHIFIYAS